MTTYSMPITPTSAQPDLIVPDIHLRMRSISHNCLLTGTKPLCRRVTPHWRVRIARRKNSLLRKASESVKRASHRQVQQSKLGSGEQEGGGGGAVRESEDPI